MGMSTHIVGFKPPDEKWQNMKRIYEACESAGISPPKEVSEFFNHEAPDDQGVEVDFEYYDKGYKYHECTKKWEGVDSSGFEIDVSKLPKDVTIIRFFNSY